MCLIREDSTESKSTCTFFFIRTKLEHGGPKVNKNK